MKVSFLAVMVILVLTMGAWSLQHQAYKKQHKALLNMRKSYNECSTKLREGGYTEKEAKDYSQYKPSYRAYLKY